MHYKKDTHVYSTNYEDIGRIKRVIINPITRAVTHVVVPRGPYFSEDKVILVDYFDRATEAGVILRRDVDDLNDLPRFDEIEFVSIDSSEMEAFLDEVEKGPFYLYWNPAAEGGSPLTYNWLLWYRQHVQ